MTHGHAVPSRRFPTRAAAVALVTALATAIAPTPATAAPAPATASLPATALTPAIAPAPATAAAAQSHDRVVSAVPQAGTPDILDGLVTVIHESGGTVVAGGEFTRVRSAGATAEVARPYIFAFDKATGAVDPAFAPALDGTVSEIIGGPTPGTVYVAGRFKQVGVDQPKRVKLALLDLADGSVVDTFDPPAFDGLITDLELVGGRLLVGGRFALADTTVRQGLASLDAVTGALDEYLTVALTEHHSWTEGRPGWQEGGIGAKKMAVSPDRSSLVVIGNFRRADGLLHDQIVKINLGASGATVTDWDTEAYRPICHPESYDSYVRDVAFSPDGSYFVVVATGGAVDGTLCDTAVRWETAAAGPGQQPTWSAFTGGDTLLSVAISGPAVYIGGHQRWVNNDRGHDEAAPGAIPRPAIAALDPLSGLPLAWNPGMNPRGFGVEALHLTPTGLWIGSDAEWIGDMEYQRRRIAFFPLSGGTVPHSTATLASPGRVYTFGTEVPPTPAGTDDSAYARPFDGTTAGSPVEVADGEAFPYSGARGGFLVGDTVFVAHGSTLYRRTLDARAPDATTLGPVRPVDPYADPKWSSVPTEPDRGSRETYAGVKPDFYRELPDVTGMFYQAGRMYYTIDGRDALYWRWFNPDSGAIGATRSAVEGNSMADSGGVFLFGGRLYLVDRGSGDLLRMDWSGGRPGGTPTTVSGPGLDGHDWRAQVIFAGP